MNIEKRDVGIKVMYLILFLIFVPCKQVDASGFDEKLTCKKVDFSKPCWLKASNKDCYIWNEAPEQGESLLILSGNCKNRLLTGKTTIKLMGEEEKTVEGTCSAGIFRGKSVITWNDGNKMIVDEEQDTNKFCGILISEKTGSVNMGYFVDGKFWGNANSFILFKGMVLCYGKFVDLFQQREGFCFFGNGDRVSGTFKSLTHPVGRGVYRKANGLTEEGIFNGSTSLADQDVLFRFQDMVYQGHFSKTGALDGDAKLIIRTQEGIVTYKFTMNNYFISGNVTVITPTKKKISMRWKNSFPDTIDSKWNILLGKKMKTLILAITSEKKFSWIDYKKKTFSTGTYYGELKNGKREGRGVFVSDDGKLYYGHWKNDKRDGKGFMQTMPDCKMQEGVWKKDQLIKPTPESNVWPTKLKKSDKKKKYDK